MRPKLTYSNVVSTLCLFLLLGGGAAYATGHHLGKNSVGSKQLKKNAVTSAKIKANSVNGSKVANGSLSGIDVHDGSLAGADIQDGSLTGADINQGSLTDVRAANVTRIAMDPGCQAAQPLPSGVTVNPGSFGTCIFNFPTPPTDCAATAVVHIRGFAGGVFHVTERTAQVVDFKASPNNLDVLIFQEGVPADLGFDLILVC